MASTSLVSKQDSYTVLIKNTVTQVRLPAGAYFTIGSIQYSNGANLILNLGTSGVGGIDTGAVAGNKTYFVYAVLSSNVPVLIYSLSNSAPTGYTTSTSKQVGGFYTDGSSQVMGIIGDWITYTPVRTSDGTSASFSARGGTFAFRQVGRNVYMSGLGVFGESGSGSGGTFIKVTVPPPLPGRTSLNQFGIGSIGRSSISAVAVTAGSGGISSADVANFILHKLTSSFWIDGDASSGQGFAWSVNGVYETDPTLTPTFQTI